VESGPFSAGKRGVVRPLRPSLATGLYQFAIVGAYSIALLYIVFKLDELFQSCNLMLIETVAKQPFSFQVVPFDAPRNHITVHVRRLLVFRTATCVLSHRIWSISLLIGLSLFSHVLESQYQHSVHNTWVSNFHEQFAKAMLENKTVHCISVSNQWSDIVVIC